MNAYTTSKVTMWTTIALLILASFPKMADAGPIAFTTCVSAMGGGICGVAVTAAIPTCAGAIVVPPVWVACMTAAIGSGCTAGLVGCVPAFFLPIP